MIFQKGRLMERVVSAKSWKFISKYLSRCPRQRGSRGRPRCKDRDVYEAIMWLLNSGARWQDMPDHFPAKSSCHRRFQQWCRDGSWNSLQKAIVRKLSRKKRLDLEESFIDGSLIQAKKGAIALARDERVRGLN